MILKFVRLALSDIKLSLRLIHPRRIKNALRFLIFDNGNLPQLYKRYQNIYGSEKTGSADSAFTEVIMARGKRDIFIFPIIDWDFRYQRPQHIASHLARLGYRVFYFSIMPLVTSRTNEYELAKTSEKLVYLCRLRAPSGVNDDLHRQNMSSTTMKEYQTAARAMMLDVKIIDPVIILNHYYWTPLCRSLPRSALIYDCMDHHAAFLEPARTGIPCIEKELIEACDCVVTSSAYLNEKVSAIRPSTIIRNGCDSDFFSAVPQKLSTDAQPVAGYVGAISAWFDAPLLADVARLLHSWRFVLVGSLDGCDISELKHLPNVQLVGEVKYSLVPAYIAQFDVCIIPFKLTELTKATNPVKVYEYLSAGRPVVATALPELLLLSDLVSIADTPTSFAKQLENALLQANDLQLTRGFKGWAKNQDWVARTEEFARLIEETVVKASQARI